MVAPTDATCRDCWIDTVSSYSDKIVLCQLHATAEVTAKQRDQLLPLVVWINDIISTAKDGGNAWVALRDQLGAQDWALALGMGATIAAAQPAAETTDGHLHYWKQARHREYIKGTWKVHYCQLCTITPCYQYRCIVEPDWQPENQE